MLVTGPIPIGVAASNAGVVPICPPRAGAGRSPACYGEKC